MDTQLSQLPTPPQGQTGISLDQFSHLPPPPSGQTGMTLAQAQNQTSSVPNNSFGGNIIPQAKPNTLDSTLSNLPGVLGGLASGVYNAGKGLLNLGKDATVDTFNAVNHPIDAIGKGANFLWNEVVNQGAGNEHLDSVGQLIQSTLGSKGALGVGQQVGNLINNNVLGENTDNKFSGSKLAGDTLNTILTAITGGKGTLTAPLLESSVSSAIKNGIITDAMGQTLLKYGTGLVGKSFESGVVGAGFQAGTNLQNGRPVMENTRQAFNAGLAVPSLLKGATVATNATVGIGKQFLKPSAVTQGGIDTLAGTIVQGKTGDIAAAKSVLGNVNPSDIKTYKDLSSNLDTQIKTSSGVQDTFLDKNPTPKTLDNLSTTITKKVNGQDVTVTHNYVQDAINQLKDYYKGTNDQIGIEKVNQLETKANTQGLTPKEVNDLARVHGSELNGFNANGQLASGLTKQTAENTRIGLKETAGEMSGDSKTFKANDKAISDTINTRDLVKNVGEKVNQLQQRIQERSLGAKVGNLLGKAINLVGLGTPKGIVEALIPRGQGFKVMNALDLEANLNKNLVKLQEALSGKNEAEVTAKLQKIINDNQGKQLLKN